MKLIYKAFSILFVSVAMQSCSLMGSIDDITPEHVLTDEAVIIDAFTAQVALNGVYSSIRSFEVSTFRGCMSLWAGTCDNINVGGASDFKGGNNNETSIKVENTGVEGVYRGYYYVINTVNSFIANLNAANPADLPEVRKVEMLAEARCMRALMNMHLLRLFGEYYDIDSEYGIVLYQEPVRVNVPKARSKVADCYRLIEDDLKFALEYAPEVQYVHTKFSRLVAKALLARVYLTKCEYADAAELAGQVIDETKGEYPAYGLEGDYLSVFTNQFNSPEMLYAPYISKASSELISSPWNSTLPGRLLKVLSTSMVKEGLEPRFEKTYKKVYNINQTAKYPFVEDYTDLNTYYFMRLPEVYFIKAEADARLGKYGDAREMMRPFCDRAGGYDADYVDNIADADVLGAVLKNKLMELSVENGEEWFDLVRYHQKGGFESWSDAEKASLPAFNQILLPIPRAAMAGNDLLIQNPEYQSL